MVKFCFIKAIKQWKLPNKDTKQSEFSKEVIKSIVNFRGIHKEESQEAH